MVAEDEPSLCQFLGELLATDYLVELASNGEQAWDAIQQECPDMVLSNVDMPGLDGFDLVQQMRGQPATAAVPMLLLSAQVGREAMEKGLALGANGWLQKPFRVSELFSLLKALGSR